MDFVNVVVSFLTSSVFNRLAAVQLVAQPDHQVNQKPKETRNHEEQEHQKEFAKLREQKNMLECELHKLLASKDEKSEKIEKLARHCDVLQKAMDSCCNEFIHINQRYHSDLEELMQRRSLLAEKNTNLLAMKDVQLEKMRKLLEDRDSVSKENDQLRVELEQQRQEYENELKKRKELQIRLEEKENILTLKDSKLEQMKRLLSNEEIYSGFVKEELFKKGKDFALVSSELGKKEKLLAVQESLSRNLKEELRELHHTNEKLVAKLLMKDKECLSRDKVIIQINEDLLEAWESKDELAKELANKEAEFSTISQIKDEKIKELEIIVSEIKEQASIEHQIFSTNPISTTGGYRLHVAHDRHSLMQLKDIVNVFIGIRERLIDLGIFLYSAIFESFGRWLSENEQDSPPRKKIKLVTSQDKPKKASLRNREGDAISTEATLKTVRGIVNQLTLSNYKNMLQKINKVDIKYQDCLQGVIAFFFAKAVDESIFSPMYAKMCSVFCATRVVSSSNHMETVSFRRVLLIHCLEILKKNSAYLEHVKMVKKEKKHAETKEKKKQFQKDLNELVDKNRRVLLGNINFICELFKIKVITFKMLHQCIRQLLNQHEEDESLECLCQLFTNIGKEIEMPTIADEAAKVNRVQYMNSVIERLRTFVGDQRISIRVRFMIQNVLKLRKNAWKPRQEENGPKIVEKNTKNYEMNSGWECTDDMTSILPSQKKTKQLNLRHLCQTVGSSPISPS